MKRNFLNKLMLIVLILSTFMGISGCAKTDYEKAIRHSGQYQVTDKDVVEFSNHVRHMLRTKMKWATVAAYVGSTISLATAAAAATVGVTSDGGRTVIRTVAALSAGSLFSNDLLSLLNLRDRATAYQDGVALIETSEARYYKNIAGQYKGKVSAFKMTSAGADFYTETIGALKLVEKALVNSIPTLEEVKQATGEHSDLRVSSLAVTLTDENKGTDILVLKNGPVVGAASSHPSLVGVEAKGSILEIRGKDALFTASEDAKKNIKITAVSAQGESVVITVNGAEDESDADEEVKEGEIPKISASSHNVMLVRNADEDLKANDISSKKQSQLTPTGWDQAEELDKILRTLKVTTIYTLHNCRALQTILPVLEQNEKVVVKVFKFNQDSGYQDLDPSNCKTGNFTNKTKERFTALLKKPEGGDTTTLQSLRWVISDIRNNKVGETSLVVHDGQWSKLLAESEGFNSNFPGGWLSDKEVKQRFDILVHLTTKDGKAKTHRLHDYFKDADRSKLGFSGPVSHQVNLDDLKLDKGLELKLDTQLLLGSIGKTIRFERMDDKESLIKTNSLKILFKDNSPKSLFEIGENIPFHDGNKSLKLILHQPSFVNLALPKVQKITLKLVGGEFVDRKKDTVTFIFSADSSDTPQTAANGTEGESGGQ